MCMMNDVSNIYSKSRDGMFVEDVTRIDLHALTTVASVNVAFVRWITTVPGSNRFISSNCKSLEYSFFQLLNKMKYSYHLYI